MEAPRPKQRLAVRLAPGIPGICRAPSGASAQSERDILGLRGDGIELALLGTDSQRAVQRVTCKQPGYTGIDCYQLLLFKHGCL